METIAGYGSSSDSDTEPAVSYGAIASFKNKLRVLNSTPTVAERDEVRLLVLSYAYLRVSFIGVYCLINMYKFN